MSKTSYARALAILVAYPAVVAAGTLVLFKHRDV
jgi:hypothetical protein